MNTQRYIPGVSQIVSDIPNYMTYKEYRLRVINECAKLIGEHTREFWETQCSFEDEYVEKLNVEDVAQIQADAL